LGKPKPGDKIPSSYNASIKEAFIEKTKGKKEARRIPLGGKCPKELQK